MLWVAKWARSQTQRAFISRCLTCRRDLRYGLHDVRMIGNGMQMRPLTGFLNSVAWRSLKTRSWTLLHPATGIGPSTCCLESRRAWASISPAKPLSFVLEHFSVGCFIQGLTNGQGGGSAKTLPME